MTQTTIFKINQSQVVIIPKALEFPEGVTKVTIISIGNARLITPAGSSWDSWFDVEQVTDDFMDEREQPSSP